MRFAETDAQGIANNSVYLVWFGLARVEYLERFAGGYPALRAKGIEAFVTASLRTSTEGETCHAIVDARTFRPTRVPDWLADAIGRAEAATA